MKSQKPPLGYYLTLLLFSLLVSSCDKQVTEDFPLDYGFDYFPLDTGKYRVYAVDSVIYDPVAGGTFVDTISLQVKEAVADTFTDAAGRPGFVLERAQRFNEDEDWIVTDYWYVVQDSQTLVLTEENLPFVKLVFPLKKHVNWDGNQFIDQGQIVDVRGESIEMFKNWYYEVTDLMDTDTVGNQSFSAVALISQADDENLIEKRYSIEKYARGIGLIYKEMWILDTQNTDGAISWEQRAEKGFILRQQLIEYN